jgi:flagellar P-ring protein precursor FlgI
MRLDAQTLAVGLLLWTVLAAPVRAEARIKDITDLEGAQTNQLVGFGLVVGLDNTGGRSQFTQKVAVDMLRRFNLSSRIASSDRAENVYRAGTASAVMVTAELGPFARRGSRIDVTVSIVDDATSLQGGTLLLTPLKGADSVIYAVAQGSVSVGGFVFSVPSGSNQPLASAQKNHPSVGRIPAGAIVEQEARGNILCDGQIRLLLRQPDFVTAYNVALVINKRFPGTAFTLDAGSVQVVVPLAFLPANVVGFVGELGLLEVTTDVTARVVINERTGTIVAGEDVRVSTVAVAHANLAITSALEPVVSQPAPFSGGRTTVVPQPVVGVQEQTGTLRVIERTVTVAELARALNALGVLPRDLIAIFQALKQAGALHAELVVI